MRNLIFILHFFLLAAPVSGVTAGRDSVSDIVRRILLIRDQRIDTDDALTGFLDHPHPEVRRQALIAYAHIQEDIPIARIAVLLDDPDALIRETAAFTLGHSAVPQSLPNLLRNLRTETYTRVRERICESIGTLITQDDLGAYLVNPQTRNAPPGEVARLIARCAIRGVKSKNAAAHLRSAAGSRTVIDRYWASYTLARLRDRSLSELLVQELSRLVRDDEPEIRMNAILAMAAIKDSARFARLLLAIEGDDDWRVRVNSVRALSLSDWALDDTLLSYLFRNLTKNEIHVQRAALFCLSSRGRSLSADDLDVAATAVRSLIERKDLVPMVRGEAVVTYSEIMGKEALGYLRRLLEDPGEIPVGSILTALGSCPDPGAVGILKSFKPERDDRSVEGGRLDGYRKVLTWAESDVRAEIVPDLLTYLQSGDLALVTRAAEICTDSLIHCAGASEVILKTATDALESLNHVQDVEPIVALCGLISTLARQEALPALERKLSMPDAVIRNAASSAIEQLTGVKVKPRTFRPVFAVYDWDFIDTLSHGCIVECVTERGTIIMEFYPSEAPFTVQNLLRLVEQGYYDGLTFHRVVPNFVIQGGDPRGDGWGGPGWTMRSEISLRRFSRGSIGLASAGKDTEGSQLFITHCATPHLDGRYTLCGAVTRGIEVVDRIQAGDKIVRMRRLP